MYNLMLNKHVKKLKLKSINVIYIILSSKQELYDIII